MTLPALALFVALAALSPLDHSSFDALLRAHVRGGLVDYDAFARSRTFPVYLDGLASASLAGRDERERLAFWINTYNAYTIRLVTAHGERESIRNVNRTPSAGGPDGPWAERLVRAAGRTLSLDEVEHGIIRKEFEEPRCHFALVCAALGCPPLRPEAYDAVRLDAQLDDQARAFLLRSPQKNRVDLPGATLWLSPLLDWYRDDFGGTDAAIGRFLAHYWPAGPERDLLLSGRFTRRETPYDWRLNAVR